MGVPAGGGISRRWALVGLTGVAAAVLITACGQLAPNTQERVSSSGPFPDRAVSSGTVRFAADFTQPPGNFRENNQMTGSDYELCNALAKAMGVKAEWEDIKFASLIEGVNSGRTDVACGSVFIRPERAEVLNFVPYRKAGQGAAVRKGNPQSIRGIDDLCGKSVALLLGSVYDRLITEQNDKCVAAGKQPIDIKKFNTVADAYAQLQNGRADAVPGDDPIISYYVSKSDGQLQVAYSGGNAAFFGLGVAKQNLGLVGNLTAALYKLKTDGTYQQILKKWNIEDEVIDTF